MNFVNFLVFCCVGSFFLLGKGCNKSSWKISSWAGAVIFLSTYMVMPNEEIYLLLSAYAVAVGVIVENGLRLD